MTPSRWRRMVERKCKPAMKWMANLPVIPDIDAIKLLQREHRAVVRKVKALRDETGDYDM